jgi:WD40 repeat protein
MSFLGSIKKALRGQGSGRAAEPSPGSGGHTAAVYSVAFSPDGLHVASASKDGTARIWDAAAGREIRVLRGHRDNVAAAVFSPDGMRLATSSFDKTIRIWDTADWRCLRTLWGHSDVVASLAFTPDGKSLLSSGAWDKTVRIWDLAGKGSTRVLVERPASVWGLAVSSSGRFFTALGSKDRKFEIFELANGRSVRTIGGSSEINDLAFSPDSRVLAGACEDRAVRIWDVESGEAVQQLLGHAGSVSSVAFGPDGKSLVSGSADHTVRLWNLDTGREVRVFHDHTAAVFSVAVSPLGSTIASAGLDGKVAIRDSAAGSAPSAQPRTGQSSADIPRALPATEAEAVDRLVAIYRANTEGFTLGSSAPEAKEIRGIGAMLDAQGGMPLMLRVHAAFAARSGVFGASRNLEIMWDRIGEWLG